MCNCHNVEMGTFETEVKLPAPSFIDTNYVADGKIAVDACLADEIQTLWNEGVETAWCCCGHSKTDGIIITHENSIQKMNGLGYEQKINPHDEARKDCFYPRSVEKVPRDHLGLSAEDYEQAAKAYEEAAKAARRGDTLCGLTFSMDADRLLKRAKSAHFDADCLHALTSPADNKETGE